MEPKLISTSLPLPAPSQASPWLPRRRHHQHRRSILLADTRMIQFKASPCLISRRHPLSQPDAALTPCHSRPLPHRTWNRPVAALRRTTAQSPVLPVPICTCSSLNPIRRRFSLCLARRRRPNLPAS
ncbi:hypothetical protein M0R45_000465 [Rubus argutus]|uniref:Uncharacterized protein n=1 Tax=Rubus argutus TaxID=59490 RepID=A0AAW1VP56_RUBAR